MPTRLFIAASMAALLAGIATAADTPPGHDQAIGQQFHITVDSLPEPDVLAQEIVDNLEAALQHFRGVSEDLSEADGIEALA